MYARVTRYQCDSARIDEMTAKVASLGARVKAIDGVITAYSAWRDDGNGVTIAIYESQAAAEAAASKIQAIWGEIADLLTGPPSPETFENVAHLTG